MAGIASMRPMFSRELGVAMLSSVLGSEQAILANISIMRTFVKLRQSQLNQEELGQRVSQLEWRQSEQVNRFARYSKQWSD